jgi:hypothetical protein
MCVYYTFTRYNIFCIFKLISEALKVYLNHHVVIMLLSDINFNSHFNNNNSTNVSGVEKCMTWKGRKKNQSDKETEAWPVIMVFMLCAHVNNTTRKKIMNWRCGTHYPFETRNSST